MFSFDEINHFEYMIYSVFFAFFSVLFFIFRLCIHTHTHTAVFDPNFLSSFCVLFLSLGTIFRSYSPLQDVAWDF